MPTTPDALRAKYRGQRGVWLVRSAPARNELGNSFELGYYEGPFEAVLDAVIAEHRRVFLDDPWCGQVEPIYPRHVAPYRTPPLAPGPSLLLQTYPYGRCTLCGSPVDCDVDQGQLISTYCSLLECRLRQAREACPVCSHGRPLTALGAPSVDPEPPHTCAGCGHTWARTRPSK